MDEFGVLTEKYGLKPQGKSAPMAESKRKQHQKAEKISGSGDGSVGFDGNSYFGTSMKQGNDGFDGNFDGSSFNFESMLGGSYKGNVDDDIFGGMPALNCSGGSGTEESRLVGDLLGGFGGSGDSEVQGDVKRSGQAGDLLGGFGGMDEKLDRKDDGNVGEVKISGTDLKRDLEGDLLGDFGGSEGKGEVKGHSEDLKQGGVVGDLLGGFGGSEETLEGGGGKNEREMNKNEDGIDDLIPGLGGSANNDNRANIENEQPQQSTIHSHESATKAADPFIVLESGSSPGNTAFTDHLDKLGELTTPEVTRPGGLRPPPNSNKVRDSESSLLDDLEDSATGTVANNTTIYANFDFWDAKEQNSPVANRFNEAEDAGYENLQTSDGLDSISAMNFHLSSVHKPKATYPDPLFNTNVYSEGSPGAAQETPSGVSANVGKPSSCSNFDNLSSLFEAATGCEGFEEIEGESEERRIIRLARFERRKARVATALAEMNQRDHQRQQEHEERLRVAEAMDSKIKHWAMGKEGNMRALLSSLQDVLWSECDWQPITLTDLITSSSVKKVYYKATLCVHPDKVQQKGASVQEKYIAEKVFDILKVAYNKFNKEELS